MKCDRRQPSCGVALRVERYPVPGLGNPQNAPVVVDAIRRAVAFTRDSQAAAIVTNPINKAVLKAGGFGHRAMQVSCNFIRTASRRTRHDAGL